MTSRKSVEVTQLPKPAGPYSSCVRIGNIVAASGQAGMNPEGKLVSGLRAQVRQTLDNLQHALKSQGLSFLDVLHVRVYLTQVEHFAEMNEEYAQVFTEPFPARTTVFVQLPSGMLVEMDALAVGSHDGA